MIEELTKAEAGYIAGFVDADGSIILRIKHREITTPNMSPFYFVPMLDITNIDQEVLLWIAKKCGGNENLVKFHMPTGRQKRVYYRLYCTTNVLRFMLPQIIPYMHVKKTRAKLMVEYLELTGQVGKESRPEKRKAAYLARLPEYCRIFSMIKCLNNGMSFDWEEPRRILTKKLGELQGTLNSKEHGNLQASRSNVLDMVDRSLQRLTVEDAQTNNTDTSAQRETEDIVRAYGKP